MDFLIVLPRAAPLLRRTVAATTCIALGVRGVLVVLVVLRAAPRTVLVAVALAVLAPGMVQAASVEYAVKAAYLYKFGIYVDWPTGAFASPAAPLQLCVLGDDPFGAALDTAAREQQVDGHPVVVRRLQSVERNSGCHILYLGFADARRVAEVQGKLRGTAVLTVGDARGGGGGVITFVISDNRVRFKIDDEAAAQNGLTISSKLLSLALSVKPRKAKEAR